MIKFLLSLPFLLIANFAFGNNVQPSNGFSNNTLSVNVEAKASFIEYTTVSADGVDSCYYRTCKIYTQEQGDGSSVEVRVCSDWQPIACPIEEEAPKDPFYT